ncbi:membrane protein [Rodentibacter pneumotropicus]|uniref:Membrane protein n=1 Tax=Rodentibacter pneumotropicus TaxID=758 RepID=A0A3S4TV34_9PAST|nr:membrane protein [Rodentibacter pneumotropicus]
MPTLKQFISGDGMYMTGQLDVGRYYGNTDSGFLRQILYGGVVYALVCFFVTFYFVRKVALNWFDGSWKFILSAFVILAACNIKADTFAFPGIMFVMLMFLSLFGVHGKQRIFLVQNEEKMFSIIVPSYNRKSEIPALLESLNHQTNKDFEVVIIDDNSQDPVVVEKFYPFKVNVIRNETNQGAAESRNIGARAATEEWLLF